MIEEQAVIVTFVYGLRNLKPLHDFEDRLQNVLSSNDVGEYDGHEIAIDLSDGFLYMYGADADKLFDVALPIMKETPFLIGAKVKLRFGPPEEGVDERFRLI